MKNILLLSRHDGYAQALAARLRNAQCSVESATDMKWLLWALRHSEEQVDVVILDVDALGPDLQWLDAINKILRGQPNLTPVICVSRSYRGPYLQLQIERKGARLAYVRPVCTRDGNR